MKRGYVGDIVPLLPAMMAGATMDQAHSPPHLPHQSPSHSPPQSPPYLPPHSSHLCPYESTSHLRVTSLEKELKDTKQTLGNVVLNLVKKVKSLEKALKRKSKKVFVSASEGEEPEDQGRIIHDIDDDPLVSLVRESMKENVSKAKSTDKGKKYRRRVWSMAKKINTQLDAEDEINTGRVEINSGIEDVNTEGKAQMVEEDIQATYKTKEQIRQEEAGLEEAIRLQDQMDEEAEVQKATQFYTEEDWDTIRANLEANTKVVKSLQGESISNDDFSKRMVEMINEKKKFYAEQKAKAKRKLKTEFEKLMNSIESFVPMETEARVKRHGLQLEQETLKKQKIDIEDA
ncbi:hypothetical protein Tco_1185256 [Tanacetum coccineum]